MSFFQNQIIRIVTCTLFAGRHPFHAPPRQRPALRPFCGLRSGDFSFFGMSTVRRAKAV
nr:MAG TPA: hypothetical protein [Caudoviricetes sp.]